eukprot:GILJ01004434.1.p1 GENE.GILJ01004434.1~~GILJ01004434.1.p1  ORF type:complete len:205 (+),score=26.80 GILJ01004434.1:41-655(+)
MEPSSPTSGLRDEQGFAIPQPKMRSPARSSSRSPPVSPKFGSASLAPPTEHLPAGTSRKKVAVADGKSQSDWIRMMEHNRNPVGMLGMPLQHFTMEQVAEHNEEHDAWTVLNGRVYDITSYIPYHPGGIPKIKLAMGKDCTKLFNAYHPWVNSEILIGKLLIGMLAPHHHPAIRPLSPSQRAEDLQDRDRTSSSSSSQPDPMDV